MIQIENGWRNARERKPEAIQRGVFREVETENGNSNADPPCDAVKAAIIIYGKRVGTTITVCTDDDCLIHDLRGAGPEAEDPAPQMPPSHEAETEAEERKRIHEQQMKQYREDQERRAENIRLEDERRQKEWEVEHAHSEKLQKARQVKFDCILAHAPVMFTASQ